MRYLIFLTLLFTSCSTPNAVLGEPAIVTINGSTTPKTVTLKTTERLWDVKLVILVFDDVKIVMSDFPCFIESGRYVCLRDELPIGTYEFLVDTSETLASSIYWSRIPPR